MVTYTVINYLQIIYDIQNNLSIQYRELEYFQRIKESKRIINKLKKEIKDNQTKLSHYQNLFSNLGEEHY